jgi:hypothetical protein
LSSSDDEKDGEPRRRPSAGGRGGKRPPAPEVGQALRSAYQRTLDESIPPEMLDLLGKLG